MPANRRYLSLLQICATLTIIAFHAGVRIAGWGWVAVIFFFALAGLNMAKAVDRADTLSGYSWSRVRRLVFPVAVVWCLVALLALSGLGTPGAAWFLIAGPLFLQNLTVALFDYRFPVDRVFAHLWFLGALVQLQLLLFACRKPLMAKAPWAIALGAVATGTAFRWLATVALGGRGSEVSGRLGDILYCMPLTHIEAITFGFLVGRGAFAGVGRQLPALASLAVAASLLAAWMSGGDVSIESLTVMFPLRMGYMHIWGYALFALTAASLCSPHNALALRVQSHSAASWLDSNLSKLASLTYAAYVFHGPVLAVLENVSPWIKHQGLGPVGPVVFSVAVVGSFSLAQVARSAVSRIGMVSVSMPRSRRAATD